VLGDDLPRPIRGKSDGRNPAELLLQEVHFRGVFGVEYHSGAPADPVNDPASDYSATHYTYDPSGNRIGETDAAGNTWSWGYDLLGNQTSTSDPDAGTTTSTYDNAGQLLTTIDTLGKQTTYAYDADGRKTFTYDTTGGASPSAANETGAWTYDTLKKVCPPRPPRTRRAPAAPRYRPRC